MNSSLFKRQFILTQKKGFQLRSVWNSNKIGNYSLYSHPDLEYSFCKSTDVELHLLGCMLSYKDYTLSNSDIISKLVQHKSIIEVINNIAEYSGQFVIVYKSRDDIYIVNDATAQAEVYYDDNFSSFASQPKLLKEVLNLEKNCDSEFLEFYNSKIFKQKKNYLGNTTNLKGIYHLRANHFINIKSKEEVRYFPNCKITHLALPIAAKQAVKMLIGYIKAVEHRSKIVIPVTAGYDSRILFLASLETNAKYFICKHKNMDDNHYDLVIPKQLTKIYDKPFEIIPDNENIYADDYEASIDFPRFPDQHGKNFDDSIYLNGNISEIARNYYGYHKNLNAPKLATILGYSNLRLADKFMQSWIDKNRDRFSELGYDLLDMIYWEEKMGNWAAKAKTESAALNRQVISPFNSHELLKTLLSVPRKYRDSYNNKLYDLIIKEMSPEAAKIPINPGRKESIIKFTKQIHIYNIYKAILLRIGKN